jgi:hypothetical protein
MNTILFADNEVLLAHTEDNLHVATQQLNKTISSYNLEVYPKKTEVVMENIRYHKTLWWI